MRVPISHNGSNNKFTVPIKCFQGRWSNQRRNGAILLYKFSNPVHSQKIEKFQLKFCLKFTQRVTTMQTLSNQVTDKHAAEYSKTALMGLN